MEIGETVRSGREKGRIGHATKGKSAGRGMNGEYSADPFKPIGEIIPFVHCDQSR